MKRYGNPKETILGVSASGRRVHAVLVHDAPDGPVILRHFVRDRAKSDPFSMPDATPENVATDDVSIQIGDHPASDDSLFLQSEFGSMGGDDASDNFSGSTSAEYVAPNKIPEPFAHELMEILKQCEDAGYENPRIAFALASEHLGTVSFEAGAVSGSGEAEGGAKKSKKNGSSKDDLFKQVRTLTKDVVTQNKLAYIPMRHRASGDSTHLALYAQPNEPVSPTVRTVRERRRQAPSVGLVDTEVSLFFGLARAIGMRATSSGPGEPESGVSSASVKAPTTLVVRAGIEDTLVMFIQGDELVHFENLRSITAFDPSETVCSRVLLLQDEFGVGDADQILLFSADREDSLLESFREFFDESDVSSIRSILPTTLENLNKPVGREGILASAAALRLVDDELYKAVFLDVDFLDKKLRGPRIRLPFSWPVVAMVLILFGTTLFFVYRYVDQKQDIQHQRYTLQHYPDDVETTAAVLQSRIDSVRAQTAGLVSALDVLDSLLVGSDRWSRTLESLTNHTRDIRGIWVETIYERDSNLHIEGTATDRNQVVALASYTGANIETLKFSEIREWPVFSFTMRMPLEEELPEAAKYLRERALIEEQESRGRSVSENSSSGTSSDLLENPAG